MSYIGNTKIGKMYLGNTEIAKAYLGNDLVFQKGGAQPVIEPVFYDKLKFDGVAYIDTDIIPGEFDSFRVTLGNESTKASQHIFMCLAGENYNTGARLGSSTTSTNRNVNVYYGSTSAVGGKALAFTTTRYSFYLTPKRYGWGTTTNTLTSSAGQAAPTGPLVIGSNRTHSGGGYTGDIGPFRIYGSDAQNVSSDSGFNSFTPTHTLRPCTYGGESGLWCVETSKFYGNSAGSGTLTAFNV